MASQRIGLGPHARRRGGRAETRRPKEEAMVAAGTPSARVPAGDLVLASALLVGVLILALGYFSGESRVLLCGLMLTGCGVFCGLLRLVFRGTHLRE
jgi:hypothetical protein